MTDTTHSVHCAANGCPAAATNTRGAGGEGATWWCSNHLMAEPSRIHEVTAELRRLAWLVQLCKGIRHLINTNEWLPAAEEAYKQIALHQRSDLYMQPTRPPTATDPGRRAETDMQWLARLEGVLRDACKPAPAAPPAIPEVPAQAALAV